MNPLVVIDDGHLTTKVVFQSGGALKRFAFPSTVVLGMAEVAGGEIDGADVYFVDRQIDPNLTQIFTAYAAGHPISVDNWSADFPTSKVNRVLVHHALVQTGLCGEVEVVSTVPEPDYHQRVGAENLNTPLIDAKTANIMAGCWRRDEKTGEGEEPSYEIAGVTIRPQGIDAIYDVALSDDPVREQIEVFQARHFSENSAFAVIDIGGRSTRVTMGIWVPELYSPEVHTKRSKTVAIGVMDVVALVQGAVEKKFGAPTLAVEAVELLTQGTMTIEGIRHELGDIVTDAVDAVGSTLKVEIDAILQGNAPLGLMVICGGGAALFKDLGATYPANIVRSPDNPQFATAAGIMKSMIISDLARDGAE